ncbi:hypothetical protein ABBQ38_001795 [Trebouxia sp. C0009 RCD-2024]
MLPARPEGHKNRTDPAGQRDQRYCRSKALVGSSRSCRHWQECLASSSFLVPLASRVSSVVATATGKKVPASLSDIVYWVVNSDSHQTSQAWIVLEREQDEEKAEKPCQAAKAVADTARKVAEAAAHLAQQSCQAAARATGATAQAAKTAQMLSGLHLGSVGQTPPPTDDWYIQSSVVDLSDPKPPPVAAHAMVNTQSVAVAARLPALASSSLSAIVATVSGPASKKPGYAQVVSHDRVAPQDLLCAQSALSNRTDSAGQRDKE